MTEKKEIGKVEIESNQIVSRIRMNPRFTRPV